MHAKLFPLEAEHFWFGKISRQQAIWHQFPRSWHLDHRWNMPLIVKEAMYLLLIPILSTASPHVTCSDKAEDGECLPPWNEPATSPGTATYLLVAALGEARGFCDCRALYSLCPASSAQTPRWATLEEGDCHCHDQMLLPTPVNAWQFCTSVYLICILFR